MKWRDPHDYPHSRRRHRPGGRGGDGARPRRRRRSYQWESHIAGARRSALGHAAAGRAAGIDPAQPGGAQGAGDDAGRKGFRAINVGCARSSSSTPTCGRRATWRASRRASGRRPRHRPREHRGSLRRARARGGSRRRREPQDHHRARLDAHRPLRLRVRAQERPQASDRGAQSEHHEALGRALPGLLPAGRRAMHQRHRGRTSRIVDNRVHAARSAIRREFDVLLLENLYGDIVSDLARGWSAAWGWSAAPTSATTGGLRSGARQRAGHRGPQNRQSAGDAAVGGDDAAPHISAQDHAHRREPRDPQAGGDGGRPRGLRLEPQEPHRLPRGTDGARRPRDPPAAHRRRHQPVRRTAGPASTAT